MTMTKLGSLTLREYDYFLEQVYGLNKNLRNQKGGLLPPTSLLHQDVIQYLNDPTQIAFDSVKELIAIILVGKGDFPNFNDSLKAVNSFLNSAGNTPLDRMSLSLFLADSRNQSYPPTRFSVNPPPKPPTSLCAQFLINYLIEGRDKLNIDFFP